MKVYRHFTAGLSGKFDLKALQKRVEENNPQVEISSAKLVGEIGGIKLSGISTGSVDAGGYIDFSVDAFVFGTGIIIFEIILDGETLPESVFSRRFIQERRTISAGEGDTGKALYIHCWQFFFNTLQFTEMLSALEQVNFVDDRHQVEVHDKVLEVGLINTMYIGENIFFETKAEFGEDALVSGVDYPEGDVVFESETRVVRSDNIYYMGEASEEFLPIFRYLLYRRNLLGVYAYCMETWLELIGEESSKVRGKLGETNKIYWNKLKVQMEIWDLNFLTALTDVSRCLSLFLSTKLPSLTHEFQRENQREFSLLRERILECKKDVVYGLGNLRTPCEAHDEELLQRETEKGNERIMLLSFLAMSIPLLGAILAPGIALGTKVVSAVLLLSAPLVYQRFRRIHLDREQDKAQLAYLKSRREVVQQGIRQGLTSIENLKRNPKLDEKTRASNISFVEKTVATSKKHLKQLDEEIARISE